MKYAWLGIFMICASFTLVAQPAAKTVALASPIFSTSVGSSDRTCSIWLQADRTMLLTATEQRGDRVWEEKITLSSEGKVLKQKVTTHSPAEHQDKVVVFNGSPKLFLTNCSGWVEKPDPIQKIPGEFLEPARAYVRLVASRN